jgi:hypothetical protein
VVTSVVGNKHDRRMTSSAAASVLRPWHLVSLRVRSCRLIADGSPPGSSADVVRSNHQRAYGAVLIKQLAFVPVERFHDEQVGCYATLPGVAGQFAQDHLLKVLALAEVIVDFPDDFPRGAAAGANHACTRPLRRYRRLRPYMFAPLPSDGAAWSRAQGLPGLSTTPPGRYSRLPGLPGGAST